MARNGTFSTDDDNLILQLMKEAEESGKSNISAYAEIAEKIGRKAKSVENRYKRLTRTPKSLTEGERLALRLKDIVRDNARASEQVDRYKERYEAEKKEHNALKREYNVLRNEYENLLKTVREVLGDPEEQVAAGKEDNAHQ